MPPRAARPSGSKSQAKAAAITHAEPNKGKGKAATRRNRPYPAPRPLQDSSSLNTKGFTSSSTSDASSGGGTMITYMLTPLPEPPRMSSASSSSTKSGFPDLGMPTRDEFAAMQAQYIASLDGRKQAKALISQDMFDNIWHTLHNPWDHKIGSPQFRWWVRKMFTLGVPDEAGGFTPFVVDADESETFRHHKLAGAREVQGSGATWETTVLSGPLSPGKVIPVVLHGGKRVAIREQIYEIMCACHERAGHGGRDKTAIEIRKKYTWVPKDLIAIFVKKCPTCIWKRTGMTEDRSSNASTNSTDSLPPSGSVTPALRRGPIAIRQLQGDALTVVSGYGNPTLGLPKCSASSSASSDTGPITPTSDTNIPLHSHLVPGIGDHYLASGMYFGNHHLPLSFDSLELPSIRVTDPTRHGGPQAHAYAHQKVILPSLSQVLSGELTAARRGRGFVRQPLQALSGNYNWDLRYPSYNHLENCRAHAGAGMGTGSYAPVIDPELLGQDGRGVSAAEGS